MHPRRRGLAGALAAGLVLATLSLAPTVAQAAPTSATTASADLGRDGDRDRGPSVPDDGSTEDPVAHDPTMIKQGRYWYVIITGDAGVPNTYLPMKRSTDLVHWEELGPVFTTAPQWIVDTLGTTPADFWAPEIAYVDGEYRLYYSASQFGTNNSVIALATTPTLDPEDPDYGWTDRGLVLRSTSVPEDIDNAIDPELVVDEDGAQWLAYGSFWSGLWIRPLDEATGKPVEDAAASLVDRLWAPNAVEAPAIVRRGDLWYLFASFDYCCRGEDSEYRTVVGRSESLTGPYVDRSGLPLLGGGGTEILRGYNEFTGPGGGDVVVDGRTTYYVHHYYDADDDYLPKLSVRTVTWDRDGWPRLGDPLTGSRDIGNGSAYVSLVERSSGNVVGAVPGGPAAPLCGYEGANIALLAPDGNPCANWRVEPGDDGYVSLRNQHSNKVVDVAACGSAEGTNVGQWGWLHNDCQQFRFVETTDGWTTLQSKVQPDGQPGKLLDGGVTCAVGDNVTISSPQVDGCQEFRMQPQGEVLLVSDATGEAVTRSGHLRTKGRLTTWEFEHTSEGYLRVTAAHGRDLRVRGCDRPRGADRGDRVDRGGDGRDDGRGDHRSDGVRACEEWRLVAQADGSWTLVDRATGRVLGLTRGDRLALEEPTGAEDQRFRLVLP